MKQSELNHLRRLLGWVRCEYFFEPEEFVDLVREHAAMGIGPGDDAAKQRLVEYHDKLRRAPKYVHAALKALHPLVGGPADIVDAGEAQKKLPSPHPL